MSTRFLGIHPSDAGGIVPAVQRAGNAGARAMQLFTAPPTYSAQTDAESTLTGHTRPRHPSRARRPYSLFLENFMAQA